jgi:hypothetical protein
LNGITIRGFEVSELATTQPEPSPQVALAATIRQMVKQCGADNWETQGFQIAERIRTETQVNAVVRVVLLTEVLDCANECGWGADAEIAQLQATLKKLNAQNIRWVDPDDVDSVKKTKLCQEALSDIEKGVPLAGIVKLIDMNAKIVSRREAMLRPLCLSARLAGGGAADVRGVLIRSDDPTPLWKVLLPPVAIPDGRLLKVVAADADGLTRTLRRIGKIVSGRPEIDTDPGVPEGSMVFVCDEPGP